MSEEFRKLERTENVKRNVSFGLINKVVALLLPFIVRTVLIYKFGVDYLGLNSVFSSILQVLSLAELGFGTAVVFSLYEPIARDDTETICAYLNTYRKVYLVMGGVVLALGLIIMPFLPFLVRGRVIPGDLNLYLWYFVFLSDAVISYLLYAYKMCIPTAFQRDDLLSRIDIAIMTIKSVLQILVLLYSRNFYLYLIMFPITTVLRNFMISAVVSKKFPEYTARGSISKEQSADLRKRVGGLMINRVCMISRNGIDSVCISAFLGLTITGIYHSYFYVLNALVGISMILGTAMTPGVGNSIVTDTREKNYTDMRRFNYLYMIIAGWASVCMLCLYQPFVRVWLGEKLMLSNAAVIALSLYFYVLKMVDMRTVYSEAAGLWWDFRYMMIIEAIANIALNIILVRAWGVVGIISSTIISLIFANFLGSSGILFKQYFKNGKLGEFFADHARYFLVTAAVTVVTYGACFGASQLVSGSKWGILLVRAVICAVLPAALFFLIYGRTQAFREAVGWVKRKVLKR